jgi:hypothetical protein
MVHLHGQLGYSSLGLSPGRKFGATIDIDGLRKSIDQIKIIHEDISDGRDGDFTKAKLLIEQADRVYLMGFGFNRLNVERLAGKTFATAWGLRAKEVSEIEKMTNSKIQFFAGYDCMSLCREVVAWS